MDGMRRALALAASMSALTALLATDRVRAQTDGYPSRPIRIVVPFATGGGTDILARALGQRLAAAMGASVLVDNRPGAGGNLGAEIAANAPADGYTLLIVSASYAVNAAYQPPRFDPLHALVPVAQIATVPFVLLARKTLPADDIAGLLELARRKPGELTYASSGMGSSPHLAGEQFVAMTGTRMIHVPYKGGGPALTDLLGGQVDLLFSTVVQGLPNVKAGKVKPLAIAGRERSAVLPGVPTIQESGVPGFDVTNWFGVLAPAGVPPDILARLNRQIVAQLATPELREQLAAEGAEPTSGDPAQFGRLIDSDIRKYAAVVEKAGLRRQ